MIDWLLSRSAVLLGLGVLLGATILAVLFREGPLGNIASISGLAVSFLGFVVTIATILDARRQIQEASERARRERAEARAETRRAVEAIAFQLTAADCASLRHTVEDLRQAALDAHWPRALYRCHDSLTVVYRLAAHRHLTSEEALAIRAAADGLRQIGRFIEKNRLRGQTGLLFEVHIQSLDNMIALLAQIQARLHQEPLQPPEATPDSD